MTRPRDPLLERLNRLAAERRPLEVVRRLVPAGHDRPLVRLLLNGSTWPSLSKPKTTTPEGGH